MKRQAREKLWIGWAEECVTKKITFELNFE